MFDETTISRIVGIAQENGIEPAALLAVVQIESSGSPFEKDGVTPRFRFERHIFYRQLAKLAPSKLGTAIAQGLATTSIVVQDPDQKTIERKLDLLARVRAIDEECADRSCSWGLGQVMGYHALRLGFESAKAMAESMATGGVSPQIELMVRLMRADGLIGPLNAHDWTGFARGYNGKEYWKLDYHTKIAKAYAVWAAKIHVGDVVSAGSAEPAIIGDGAHGDAVEALQLRLRDAGYAIGKIDGDFGTVTRGALLAFQADYHLPLTGVGDPATLQALAIAPGRPIFPARANATVDDLRKKGSQTIALTDWLRKLAIGTGVVGALGATDVSTGVTSVLNQIVRPAAHAEPAAESSSVQPAVAPGATQDSGGAPTPPPAPAGPAGGGAQGGAAPDAATPPKVDDDAITALFVLLQGLLGTQGGLGILTLVGAVLLWQNGGQIADRRVATHRDASNLDK